MTTRSLLIELLTSYHSFYEEENAFRKEFIELLQHPHSFYRDHLPGHITGSAWIIDETRKFTLLTHHIKLNKWLQPGGHADGDENVMQVALREAEEETGLKKLQLLYPAIFDIDIHTIPARQGFPQHLHFDVRVLLQASKEDPLDVSEESYDLAWIPLTQLAEITQKNFSITRMMEKTKKLL